MLMSEIGSHVGL